MKQKIALFTIALIAVVMVMSVATPAMAEHNANGKSKDKGNQGGGQDNNSGKTNNKDGQKNPKDNNGGDGGNAEKVNLCHKPGTDDQKDISVPAKAVDKHLAHGDVLGDC